MTWGNPIDFPRAILHIDGDSFFASCEVAKNPRLRGKPVIVGRERGIVSAMTYEVKARGVTRGMRLTDAKSLCPDAVILPSDFETYSIFSHRMYSIVRRYTPEVEEYSIDECFADLTGMRRTLRMSYADIAAQIKRELDTELGMTFSIGLSATKVLAKIGSKWKKPSGLTIIPLIDAPSFLKELSVGSLWGIGRNTAAYLHKHGIYSAFDFAHKEEAWVRATVSKPYVDIWHELNGRSVLSVDTMGRESYQSISKTRTFTPPSNDPVFLFSQLSKNIESACAKARQWKLVSPQISFFLKTQDFRYHVQEITLPHPTNVPLEVLKAITPYFAKVQQPKVPYRTTGITLLKLRDDAVVQLDLFGEVSESRGVQKVFEQVDALAEKYGSRTVFLGSSIAALAREEKEQNATRSKTRALHPLTDKPRRYFGIPSLGEV